MTRNRIITAAFALLLCLSMAAQEDLPRFKVGTYNLFTSDSRVAHLKRSANKNASPQRYWSKSATAVGDMIVSLDCDILGVQEVCDSIWNGPQNIRGLVAAKGLDYKWILYPNTEHGHISYDSAIGYKPSVFEAVESGIFWMGGVYDHYGMAPDAPKGSCRPCVWARMKHIASGKEFYFFSTHLLVPQRSKDGELNYDGNKYNCQQLREKAAEMVPDGMPAILVGDMNLDDRNKTWKSLSQSMFMDTKIYFKDANLLSADAKAWGTQNNKDESGFTKWYPDHIMLNGFQPLDYVIHRDKFPTEDGTLHFPSDHLPVTVNVQFRDYSDNGPATPARGKKAVRAMSFNMRYFNNNDDLTNGWDHRKMAIPAMLEDVRPDVFGTQEQTDRQIAFLDRQCPQYKHVGIFRENDGKGECPSVYYNETTVELLDWGGFWLSETPTVSSKGWDAANKRTAVWTRMKMKQTGKEFIFISTHLDHKGEQARKEGLNLILDTLKVLNPKKLPVVLVGDFNVQPGKEALERVDREMKSARQTALSSDDKYSFNGFGKTWTGIIDYIYYSGWRKCTDFKVITRKYRHVNFISDHYPIRADLEL